MQALKSEVDSLNIAVVNLNTTMTSLQECGRPIAAADTVREVEAVSKKVENVANLHDKMLANLKYRFCYVCSVLSN